VAVRAISEDILGNFINTAYENFAKAEALAKDEAELQRIQKTKIQVSTLEISYLKNLSIRGNLMNLYYSYAKLYPSTEIDAASKSFFDFVAEEHNSLIREKNSALFDEMLKYGVGANPANTNLRYPKEQADLLAIPEEWIPWH